MNVQKILISSLLFILLSCTQAQNYDSTLKVIESKKNAFKTAYNNTSNKDSILKLAGIYFEESVCTTLQSHWFGTPWDFNGYTNVPKTGEVACGYYVSTNLKHMGININRYKMAQQTSKNEVLSIDANPQTYNGDTKGFINYAHQHLSDGLYIIGMTSHVGMIQKTGKDIYLLHSSPFDRIGVVKEKIESCPVLDYSNVFILGKISHNKAFIKKWLFNELVSVKLDHP